MDFLVDFLVKRSKELAGAASRAGSATQADHAVEVDPAALAARGATVLPYPQARPG